MRYRSLYDVAVAFALRHDGHKQARKRYSFLNPSSTLVGEQAVHWLHKTNMADFLDAFSAASDWSKPSQPTTAFRYGATNNVNPGTEPE